MKCGNAVPLAIFMLAIVCLAAAVESKKHSDKKKIHRHHSTREHHHHQKHHSGNHGKRKESARNAAEKKETQTGSEKNLREQLREFHQRINKMLPRCKEGGKCPPGTCCWKGKCKMMPHRLNQRCSTGCPCNDAKGTLYCHVKRVDAKASKYGRCYIKGTNFGMESVNFIPETIEKLKDVEKRMMKEKLADKQKSSKKRRKRQRGRGRQGKKHDKKHG